MFAAQFSFNAIDLFNPPKPINFDKLNSQPFKPVEWKKLQVTMTAQGIRSFTVEHMMPLIISRRHVDPACLSDSLNGIENRMLVLSKEGEEELGELEMAGGRHRNRALEAIKDAKEKELEKLITKRSRIVSKREVVEEEAKVRKEEHVNECDRVIGALEEELARIGRWGVILYDKGK